MTRFSTLCTGAALAVSAMLAACDDDAPLPVAAGSGSDPALPAPDPELIPTLDVAPAVGWAQGEAPVPAPGLAVAAFATGLDHPRWLHVLPNGDVLVAETNRQPSEGGGLTAWVEGLVLGVAGGDVPSADRITLLRDVDGDGEVEERAVLLDRADGLVSPFGMALLDGHLYVANTGALLRFPFRPGAAGIEAGIDAPAETVVRLPDNQPNRHWTKGLEVGADGMLYVSVGSNSDHAEGGMEAEEGRAAIWQVDPATGAARIFASGLRNPVGMGVEPGSGALWAVVNERDELGPDVPPDYLTRVREGGFYGWPWSYWGQNLDPRLDEVPQERVAEAIVPDYALGTHVAPLGLAFADGAELGDRFAEGAFVGLHGSWNRDPPAGYAVVFVPFDAGRPAGEALPVLAGFLSGDGDARGRPVGVAVDRAGALLVADDVGNTIWRVTAD